MKRVIANTDGACKGNPGPGGIGIILSYNGDSKEFASGFNETTNNQMELLAAIYALHKLTEPCIVILHTDSNYVCNGFNKKWVENWKRNGWKASKGGDVKNVKFWKLLDRLVSKHQVTFKHVPGHAGHTGNERADKLASGACYYPRKYDVDKFVNEIIQKESK